MNISATRLLRFALLAALLGLLLYSILRRFPHDRTQFGEQVSRDAIPTELVRQLQQLEGKESGIEATLWARERVADQASRTIEAAWDLLNGSPDRWKTVRELAVGNVDWPRLSDPVALPWGVRMWRPAPGGASTGPSDWPRVLASCTQDGWLINQIELRHVGFDPNRKGHPGTSRIAFVANLLLPAQDRQATVRGEISVEWSDDSTTSEWLGWKRVHATHLEVLEHAGPPPFVRLLDEEVHPPPGSPFIDPLIVQDLDGDGRCEILLVAANRIYRRQPNGPFTATPLRDPSPALVQSALVADFDRDGHLDLLVASFGGLFLHRGSDSPNFDSPATQVWTAEPRLKYVQVLTCGDVDGDGDLDLWLAQYKVPYNRGQMPTPFDDANDGHPSYLLLNDGEGHFTDATLDAGLQTKRHRRCYSASFVDLDADGDLDLVVISDFAGLDLYLNDGQGRFRERTADWTPNPRAFGMSHVFTDFNRDGQLDLLMMGMNSPTADRLNRMGLVRSAQDELQRRKQMTFGNRLFLGRPGGGFTQPDHDTPLSRSGWSWGAAAEDFDNDGYPDVYIANGHESQQSVRDYEREFWLHDIYVGNSREDVIANAYFIGKFGRTRGQGESYGGYEKNRLFLQFPSVGFLDTAPLLGVALQEDCRNVVAEDLDADGRMDLLVTTFEIWPRHRQTLKIFRNQLDATGSWIGFRFASENRERSSVGATVTLETDDGSQRRTVVTGDSYRSQRAASVHFGLGTSTHVRRAVIRWPMGGELILNNPPLHRYHLVKPASQ